MQYMSFALLYLLMREECVEGIQHFSHAFYFSVQTAATIGTPSACTHRPPPPISTVVNVPTRQTSKL